MSAVTEPAESGDESQAAAPAALKVVLVVRAGLPANQSVNAATVLGASVGSVLALPLGPVAVDGSGTSFSGIVTTPVPILVADPDALTALFRAASRRDDLTVLTLTETARRARSYEAYVSDLAVTARADADLVGVLVAGPRNHVTKLTKRLSLLA